MSETVTCPYCRATFTEETFKTAKDQQTTHLNDAHEVFDIAARGNVDELAGLVRSALDTATQRASSRVD